MIDLRNLEKSYPLAAGRVYVLRNSTLTIAEGEFVSIMGPSGAGKSTLLHILGMHDGDFTGDYEFRGEIVNKLKPRDRQELQKRNIVGKKDLYPSQLSGGQQQLVGVARAIVAKPKLILADEPTGNLHSDQGREIMELFKKLNNEGTTIIQVTHSEDNAKFGNRIIELRDGWITGSE